MTDLLIDQTFLSPLPPRARIADALESAANDAERAARTCDVHQGNPDARTEGKYWRSQVNAFSKALYQLATGINVIRTAEGTIYVPSASAAGTVYRLVRTGGVWGCSCEAGANGRLCWHHAVAVAIEAAEDQIDAEAAAAPPPAETDRARAFAEMDELF